MQTKRTHCLANSVSRSGAPAGSVLTGAIRSNAGLRLRVLEPQSRGPWGPIRGRFVVLDAGENMHTEALMPLIGRLTTASQVLEVTRRQHPMCVNIVNARTLMLEEEQY